MTIKKIRESDFSSCIVQIPFKTYKIKKSICLWYSCDIKNWIDDNNHKVCLEHLASVALPNKFFEDIEITGDATYLYAEQYGGEGVGLNGGGVRCGNAENGRLQLKGIGISPVVGYHDNLYNSYGAYPLYEAITEATNHQIYDAILPVRTVGYLAILGIGTSKYFVTAEEKSTIQFGETKLAIGVRECTTRIGHFIKSKDYQPHPDFLDHVVPDNDRVKIANSELFKSVDGDLSTLATNYLRNTAKQFAFCLINRIAHGALTPSNITLGGTFIDLTNTTFLPIGYCHRTAAGNLFSKNECHTALDIFCLFAENVGVYAGVAFDISLFKKYYYEKLNQYKSVYILEMLGLDRNYFKYIAIQDLDIILETYEALLKRQEIPLKGVPKYQKVEGEIVEFFVNIFVSLGSGNASNFDSTCSPAIKSFQCLVSQAYRFRKVRGESTKSFCTKMIIRAFRRLYFTPYFYVGRIYSSARDLVNRNEEGKAPLFINAFKSMVEWIFDKSDSNFETILLKIDSVEISYNSILDVFSIHEVGFETRAIKLNGLRGVLENIDSLKFLDNGFSFYFGIEKILDLLEAIYLQSRK